MTVEFDLVGSANIVASGEDTTFQLTAPVGKTTGDFQAGRIQDDENPADTIDLTSDKYTELEWCIKATDGAEVGEIYEFRVTKGEWKLTNIGGCKLWIRSDLGITKNGSDQVSTWEDQSGNSNDATQSTDANKFVYYANQLDGHPSLRANGTSSYMQVLGNLKTLILGNDKPFTAFAIWKSNNVTDETSILSWEDPTSVRYWLGFCKYLTGYPHYAIEVYTGPESTGLGPGPQLDTNPHAIIYTTSGTVGNYWVDGSQVITNGALDVSYLSISQFSIGARTCFSDLFFDGDFYEIGIWDNEISSASRALLNTYVTTRYPSI